MLGGTCTQALILIAAPPKPIFDMADPSSAVLDARQGRSAAMTGPGDEMLDGHECCQQSQVLNDSTVDCHYPKGAELARERAAQFNRDPAESLKLPSEHFA